MKQLLELCSLPSYDITASARANFAVARDENQIIGVVGLELFDRVALLRSLAVQKQYRGRGIARKLVQRAEAAARAAGIGELYLLTTMPVEVFFKFWYSDKATALQTLKSD